MDKDQSKSQGPKGQIKDLPERPLTAEQEKGVKGGAKSSQRGRQGKPKGLR